MSNANTPNTRVALIALSATSIEWYDFFLYGTAAALVFPVVFFPHDLPPLVAMLAAFSTFAVAFIARPIGGIIFGHFGDRHGRKKALVVALSMMGASTALIGCLPSYATVGAAAPVALVLLRFVQGLAIGGQWGGAVLLATESAPKNKRGYYGSFAQVGVPVGVILANLVFLFVSTHLSQEAFMSWGWRVPFVLSVVLIGLALYTQLRLEDSQAFRQLAESKAKREQAEIRRQAAARGVSVEQVRAQREEQRRPSPVLEALRTYPKQIALAAGSILALQVAFYLLIAWVVAYGANPAGLNLSRNMLLSAVLIGAVAMAPALVISAAISDRFGRRGIFMAGAVLLGIWGFVLFPMIDSGSFLWITVAISIAQIFVAMMYGPQAAFFTEMFSTKVRYSGASLGYQLGSILGGGLAPIIATVLLAESNSAFGVSVYIAINCVITVVSVLLLKETYQMDLEDAEHPVPRMAASQAAAQLADARQ
jgi:metabolite-proton symporter